MRKKKAAELENLSKEMWIAVGFIEAAYRFHTGKDLLITSGEDVAAGRKSNTKHKKNKNGEVNAIDGSVHGITLKQQTIILTVCRIYLDPLGYDTMIHKVKGGVRHLHCEYDPKKGEKLIRRI